MKKYFMGVMLIGISIFGFQLDAFAQFKSAKFTVVVVNEKNEPLAGINVGVGFERNTGWGTDSTGQQGRTDASGRLTFSGQCNGHITYGGSKNGYYPSYYDYDFSNRNAFSWLPWNPELKIVMRKIENPVPMYARNTKMSEIIIPAINEDIGFDLIRFDWVKPYGDGETADFTIILTSRIGSERDYDFIVKISFKPPNGIIGYKEDPDSGSQFILPRYAPESGYAESLIIFDRFLTEKGRMVSWKEDKHYIFRTRSVLDKDGNLSMAMYGKIIGDIHLGPQKDGKALLIFKYYLNPDSTRNLEFNPKRNLFRKLPSLEQVGIK